MYIKSIKLSNFRNYKQQTIQFNKDINLFFGENAQGKTNILEAIFLCAIGKSFRAKKEKELIFLDEKNANIELNYQKEDREGFIRIDLNDKKQVYINGVKQNKLSDILGIINIVMFSPDDIEILKGGPSKRRRFLNMMISQLRPRYVYCLNMYLKTLEQRNNYLRQIEKEKKDQELLDIWDEKLVEYANEVFEYRNEFINKIKEKIKKIHFDITRGQEELKIKYLSDCEFSDKFRQELKRTRQSDIERGYTSKGIHRDDIYFFINKKQVNIYGSQGQNRTVILSLKLAELEIVKEEIGEYPILLLDDFMSELDSKRRENFLKYIHHTQILITCTDLFTILEKKCKTFHIEKGNVEEVNH